MTIPSVRIFRSQGMLINECDADPELGPLKIEVRDYSPEDWTEGEPVIEQDGLQYQSMIVYQREPEELPQTNTSFRAVNKAEEILVQFYDSNQAVYDETHEDWGHISGADMIEVVAGLLDDIRKHFTDAGRRENTIDCAQGVVADLVDQYYLVRDAYEESQPILVHRIGDKIDEILAELEELREPKEK